MKVLVIATDGFGGHGGIALYTRNLLRALCSHHRRPYVVALPRLMPFPVTEPLPPNLEWDTSGLGSKPRYAGAVLRAALKRGPFDAVLCTHVNLLSLAYPLARLWNAPIALFMYGVEARKPTRPSLAYRLVSYVDALISIRLRTTRTLRSWARIDRVSEYLLENAIDLTRYGVAPKDPELVALLGVANKRVIMTLSRLGEQYVGVDEVLAALPSIARDVPNVVYVVAGGGPDLSRLRDKARALGVADRVVFAGFVTDERKAGYYRLGDVYAMPGSGPTFDRYPLRFAFLEAMACGIPVVGPRCEDEEERKADGALLAEQVDPYDSEAIARAIVRAMALPKTVPVGLERFGYPSFERRWHEIFDDILVRRPRRASSLPVKPSAANS